jgi:predicted enzyme related to lactoylglutathione lyase
VTIVYPHGMPSWVDLNSADVEGSIAFYTELLGWQAGEPGPPEAGGYRMFQLGGANVAGIGPAPEGHPTAWNTYITVDDADAIRERIEQAGGRTVAEPFDVLDAGRMAIFQDAAGGAFFSVWQPGTTRGAEVVNAVGALAMNELDTRDYEGARRFYGEVFGWEVDPIEVGGTLVYGSVKLDGRLVAGMLPMGDNFPPQVPPHWRPYFGVDDLDASLAQVTELGGRVLVEPAEVPGGRFAAALDPQGGAFSLFQGSYDPPPTQA